MRSLLIFTLVGVGAQLVDGALGMAFGVTATTLLVLSGVGAAQASAAVHLAEVGTTFASGLSHWKFKNIDWALVAKLGAPGAFLGATVLSSLSTEHAAPLMAAILVAIGAYVLLRFSLRTPLTLVRGSSHSVKFLTPLGLFGGFIDASGGGGWGPVTTSTLLSQGKTAPRTVIGSVSASEFLVAASASLGFLVGLRQEFLENWPVVVGLMVGGVIAAPFAAWLVTKVSPALLGSAVGGVIVLTNSQKLVHFFDIQWPWSTGIYSVIVVAWAALVIYAWRTSRGPKFAPEPAAAESASEPVAR
ncbi:sulfite exporter TauE/SafE family protein [Mycolicibacterium austroafricanum]|uniref:Probable membrane transporter protein n=1 Tax=Mycolicibacterium austroafricanum TaxID=39687 RepID=A0ABT8HDT1_MYCAO|nr:sulfite exporter TauE/SafE family protein [Mycolicibacterium austroafricanum]MDN4518925.1 sulfite exporter TauE/SafE family protein [Mycolicibacterium austroafricanum]QRZ04443.1 sulfite exporter TauE/SafE family protein [Mycolicibacterium austroafricanum]QZT66184.1 sulfite exporter TauE/SafE family protein [Mycolicibacterium austroafricanum]